jgi:hypothetical protein
LKYDDRFDRHVMVFACLGDIEFETDLAEGRYRPDKRVGEVHGGLLWDKVWRGL